MALQCNMIKDVRKYETKVFGPFTKRQLKCLLVSIGYSLPLALLFPLSIFDRIIVGVFLAMPGILCGYVKIDGTPPEVYAIRYIYRCFLTPGKRLRKVVSPYEQELKKMKNKNAKEKKKIKYSTKPELKIYK